ncbi:MAG: hypothetical protein ABIL00_07300 [candidate division WOR-3 bacterium]
MISVKVYSGYKGGERPQALVIEGRELPVEIIRRELKEDYQTKERKEIFTVIAENKLYKIERDQKGNWQVYEK